MGDFLTSIVDALLETFINDAGTDAIASSLKFTEGAFSVINKIWHYFIIVGIGMTVIYFLMEMNQKLALEGRDMNLKTFFAPFLKLMIAIAVLSKGAEIVSFMLGFHNDFIEYANNKFVLTLGAYDPTSYDTLKSDFDSLTGTLTFFSKVAFIIPLILMWVVNLILSLVWQYKAIGFKLEYLFKIAITPIALADVYSGQNANAVRWLKGFLGLTLYGMSFIVIQRIGASMALSNFTDMYELISGSTNPFANSIWSFLKFLAEMILVVPIAQLGVLSTIKQLTKEALG